MTMLTFSRIINCGAPKCRFNWPKLCETMGRPCTGFFKAAVYSSSNIEVHGTRELPLLYWRSSFRCARLYHVTSMSLSIGRKLVGRRSLRPNPLSQVPPSLFSDGGCAWKVHLLKCTSTYDRVNFWSVPLTSGCDGRLLPPVWQIYDD